VIPKGKGLLVDAHETGRSTAEKTGPQMVTNLLLNLRVELGWSSHTPYIGVVFWVFSGVLPSKLSRAVFLKIF
jgi:hypothetical protein